MEPKVSLLLPQNPQLVRTLRQINPATPSLHPASRRLIRNDLTLPEFLWFFGICGITRMFQICSLVMLIHLQRLHSLTEDIYQHLCFFHPSHLYMVETSNRNVYVQNAINTLDIRSKYTFMEPRFSSLVTKYRKLSTLSFCLLLYMLCCCSRMRPRNIITDHHTLLRGTQ